MIEGVRRRLGTIPECLIDVAVIGRVGAVRVRVEPVVWFVVLIGCNERIKRKWKRPLKRLHK